MRQDFFTFFDFTTVDVPLFLSVVPNISIKIRLNYRNSSLDEQICCRIFLNNICVSPLSIFSRLRITIQMLLLLQTFILSLSAVLPNAFNNRHLKSHKIIHNLQFFSFLDKQMHYGILLCNVCGIELYISMLFQSLLLS